MVLLKDFPLRMMHEVGLVSYNDPCSKPLSFLMGRHDSQMNEGKFPMASW